MQINPYARVYSQFHSVMEDGREGLVDASRGILQRDHALQEDFDVVAQAFMNGAISASELSRIELIHWPEPGVIGLIAYAVTQPKIPVLYLRSAHYNVECDGSRLANAFFTLTGVPEDIWLHFDKELVNHYYVVIVSREVIAVGENGHLKAIPQAISGEWVASTLFLQKVY